VRADPDLDGELVVRTPALRDGARRAGGGRTTASGWYRTGDLGRVDDDGFVWIDGRVSQMINRGGLKVFPAEVEEVLRLAPGVADVAVVGVPDARLGQVPWAFVVLTPGAALELPALDELARTHLAPYKVPVAVRVVDRLPRNDVGKVLARDLVAAANEEEER
jgi:acyl-CoA synthetase (AMP-forming)/AMP-acid ligase II